MITRSLARTAGQTARSFELRFTSIYCQGRGIVVPCDAAGNVDLDSLTMPLRNAYLGARALVGREYLYPTVRRTH